MRRKLLSLETERVEKDTPFARLSRDGCELDERKPACPRPTADRADPFHGRARRAAHHRAGHDREAVATAQERVESGRDLARARERTTDPGKREARRTEGTRNRYDLAAPQCRGASVEIDLGKLPRGR